MTNARNLALSFFALFLISGFCAPSLRAEENFQCEVLSLEGTATLINDSVSKPLKEGDLISVGDRIETAAASSVDLGFDKDWNNVTRIEENSKAKITSVYPTVLVVSAGGVWAKLKALPEDSTFQVETPTAVATVRGSEYRTTYENGETQTFNFSQSQVYVFGKDADGNVSDTPVILEDSQKTGVTASAASPLPPQPMTENEHKIGERFQQAVENRIHDNFVHGRTGKLPDINHVKQIYRENLQKSGPGGREPMMERQQKMMNAIQNAGGRESRRPGENRNNGGPQNGSQNENQRFGPGNNQGNMPYQQGGPGFGGQNQPRDNQGSPNNPQDDNGNQQPGGGRKNQGQRPQQRPKK